MGIRGGDAGGSNPETYNGVTYRTNIAPPQVTPDGAARVVAAIAGASLTFSISNPNTSARTYTLAATCSGIVTSCPSPPNVVVPSGQSANAAVTISTGGVGLATGTLTLTATDQDLPSAVDGGSYALTLGPSGPVVATASSQA